VRLTSSDSTFPKVPPNPISFLCAHSPVTSDRRKKTASSLSVLVHVTAKCAPLGWKSMCRISPGSLNDAIAADGSEDQLDMSAGIWAYLRYPRLLQLARLKHFCSPRPVSLVPPVRKLGQLIYERDHLQRRSGHTDMTIVWARIRSFR
jgi:hypothetical protein